MKKLVSIGILPVSHFRQITLHVRCIASGIHRGHWERNDSHLAGIIRALFPQINLN